MHLRQTNIEKLKNTSFDVLIIGGGINGAVSAASLSAKGAKVALIDKYDFAAITSQESSNLAWGGIKYLESFEFFLVNNLCKCRNHLIKNYPSTVREIRFFTTIQKGFKYPVFVIWLGTWLYFFFGRLFTKAPRFLTRKQIQKEEPIIEISNVAGGFEYSDAYLHDNDARFVFNFIRSSLNYGCIATNYVSSLGSTIDNNGEWETKAKNEISGEQFIIKSKVIINATGPFADTVNQLSHQTTKHHLVLSKGIHLIIDQLTKTKKVLTFFASDGRLFFVIPMGRRTCVGTTDTRVNTPNQKVTDEDISFVLNNINSFLKKEKPITTSDIIATRCGVRPLVIKGTTTKEMDWVKLSRKHVVETNNQDKYLTIFGGKLTDCLNVGDEVSKIVSKMGIVLKHPHYKWYGEPDQKVRMDFFHRASLLDLDSYTSKESSEKLSSRLWRRYGSTAFRLLEWIQEDPKQAEVLIKGTEYLRCELQEAAQREMVIKLEDFLRRRSKISLIERPEFIQKSIGLKDACEILFEDQAEEKIKEYFKNQPID